MKKITIALIVSGTLLIAISSFWDNASLDQERKIGAAQVLGIQIGAILLLLGAGFASTKFNLIETIKIKIQETNKIFPPTPVAFWIFLSFIAIYLAFFLFPVFLNTNHKIRYISNFIPNQGHIGFDIRSIVNRIEDWYISGTSPYADGFIAYPPLTIAILTPFVLLGFPAYFYAMTMITTLSFTISNLLIPWLTYSQNRSYWIFLFFLTGLYSYGFQFELERGQFNAIAFAICMVSIFLFRWNFELRYWAYALFTVSVQLKIYPIFFIVLFINDWRNWKENIKRVLGLGCLNALALFVLGRQMLLDFLGAILDYQFAYESNRYENLSIKGFVHSLGAGDIPHIPANISAFVAQNSMMLEGLFFALLGICLIALIVKSYNKNARAFDPYLFSWCAICCLIVPSVSNDYKLTIMIAPTTILAMHLVNLQSRPNTFGVNLLVFIYFSAYWSLLYPYITKPDVLSRNFPALILMLVLLPFLKHNRLYRK